jgi:hypothetical protein
MTKKISALTAASAYDGTELIEVVQSGANKKGLISAFATYLAGIAAWLPFSKLTGSATIAQLGSSTIGSPSGIQFMLSGVNFNAANSDNAIALSLPAGCTRFTIGNASISGASGTLTTATCSMWTGAGGTGTNVVASGTAITVSTGSENTANNRQALTLTTGTVTSFAIASVPTIYFRVQNAQGSAATANVQFAISPLP